MDTPLRTFIKTITWQVIGLFSMCAIGWMFTGSLFASGGIAITGAVCGLICYLIHERVWNRIAWGRLPARAPGE